MDTPEAFARATLKCIAQKKEVACGSWKHEIGGWVIKELIQGSLGRWNLQQAVSQKIIEGKTKKMWQKRL